MHRSISELETGLALVRESPADEGTLELIVRRPAVDARDLIDEGELDVYLGLVGDTWKERPSKSTADGSAHPDMQLTVMNSRAIALIAGERERWGLAGDQLYVDLDLSGENLPPGTRLAIGEAVIEVTSQPHRGCGKFADRFGTDALKFVNSTAGVAVNARGINAKVIRGGMIRRGDAVRKV